jgi:uncharacterized protein YajQ (UPF0234 family)
VPDNTFDVVSKIDLPEVSNAMQQALKELGQRYDLKDSKSTIELNEKDRKILLESQDEFKLKAVSDILQQKLVKRQVPLKGLEFGKILPAASSRVRQEISLQQGIPMEKAKEIIRIVKESKKKVQASIQGDLVRIAAKDRDILQEVIALLRQTDLGIDMQFTNFRSN